MFTICTTSLTFNNSTFCLHTAFMCFVLISEQTAIISLYSINWLVFVTETVCFLIIFKHFFIKNFFCLLTVKCTGLLSYLITLNVTPHSTVLLYTNDRTLAEISTWHHTTLATDRHLWPHRDSNPQSQQFGGRRPTPLTIQTLGLALSTLTPVSFQSLHTDSYCQSVATAARYSAFGTWWHTVTHGRGSEVDADGVGSQQPCSVRRNTVYTIAVRWSALLDCQ